MTPKDIAIGFVFLLLVGSKVSHSPTLSSVVEPYLNRGVLTTFATEGRETEDETLDQGTESDDMSDSGSQSDDASAP